MLIVNGISYSYLSKPVKCGIMLMLGDTSRIFGGAIMIHHITKLTHSQTGRVHYHVYYMSGRMRAVF